MTVGMAVGKLNGQREKMRETKDRVNDLPVGLDSLTAPGSILPNVGWQSF